MIRRGFTLIEVMISIAILAIVFAIGSYNVHRTNAWLTDELDLSRATAMLATAAEAMRGAPYAVVPPLDTTASSPWVACEIAGGVEIPATDGEARHVGGDLIVPLDNVPARRLLAIEVVEAAGRRPARGSLDQDVVKLSDASLEGKVVRLRYLGRYRVIAQGIRVDDNLRARPDAAAGKVVTLRIYDGEHQVPSLSTTVLRMRP